MPEPDFEPKDLLRPARYGEKEHVPGLHKSGWSWRLPATALVVVLMLVVAATWLKNRSFQQKRAALETRYQTEVVEVGEQFREMRKTLLAWVVQASSEPTNQKIDASLTRQTLQNKGVLYLRLKESDLKNADTIRAAAQQMAPDAIGRCMGGRWSWFSGFYVPVRILGEKFQQEMREADGSTELHLLEMAFQKSLDNDLPEIKELLQNNYFLLAIVRGAERKDTPIDFFLWDIRTGEQKMAIQVRTSGRLVVVGEASDVAQLALEDQVAGSTDCAIGADIRMQLESVESADKEPAAALLPSDA